MIKKSKLRKWILLLLLIPFFELQSYTMFVDNNYYAGIFENVLNLYSIARLLITLYVIVKAIRTRKLDVSLVTLEVLVFVLLENIVSAINGSLYINFLIGSISFLGLALMAQLEISKHKDDFIWAAKTLFGFFSILGAIQIILMPNGFLNHSDKAYAIYLLGAKNTSFFYYIVFLFFLFYDNLYRYKRIKKRSMLPLLLFAYAAIKCDSMNTLMMLFVLFVFTIIVNYGKLLKRFVKPPVIIIVVICISVIIISPSARVVLSPFLRLIGRDTSFTGRDILWVQAIDVFVQHPLFGNGISTEYRLVTGVLQDNAHSQFLDILSKYGIFVFFAYISMPISALWKSVHSDKKNVTLIALKSAVCFIVLFHSIIDHMAIYQYILVMESIELLWIKNTYRCVQVSKYRKKNEKWTIKI